MKPGTILYDNRFKFNNGSEGEKLFVILNDGEIGFYITVKTTSKPAFKCFQFGCQLTDKYPNFFLPKGCCCLHQNTWIELDNFFESRANELLTGHFSKQIKSIGNLSLKITCLLLKCAIKSKDISIRNRNVLKETLGFLL